jgi:hypothetical protein
VTRKYTRHGLTASRTKLRLRGMTALDRRTATARALLAARDKLERDLGGRDALSIQKRTVVELSAREMALLDHYDGFLFGQTSVLGKRGRVLVKERGAIVDRLARLLGLLGLERRMRPAPSLAELLARGASEPATQEPSADGTTEAAS